MASYRVNFPTTTLSDNEIKLKLMMTKPKLHNVRIQSSSNEIKERGVRIRVIALNGTSHKVTIKKTESYKTILRLITSTLNNFPTSLWYFDDEGDAVEIDDDLSLQSFIVGVGYGNPPEIHSYLPNLKEIPEKLGVPCCTFLRSLRSIFRRGDARE